MRIKDELEYVPGQIVNKVIAGNASGMVILMAFDKNAALATHTAPGRMRAAGRLRQKARDFHPDGSATIHRQRNGHSKPHPAGERRR